MTEEALQAQERLKACLFVKLIINFDEFWVCENNLVRIEVICNTGSLFFLQCYKFCKRLFWGFETFYEKKKTKSSQRFAFH